MNFFEEYNIPTTAPISILQIINQTAIPNNQEKHRILLLEYHATFVSLLIYYAKNEFLSHSPHQSCFYIDSLQEIPYFLSITYFRNAFSSLGILMMHGIVSNMIVQIEPRVSMSVTRQTIMNTPPTRDTSVAPTKESPITKSGIIQKRERIMRKISVAVYIFVPFSYSEWFIQLISFEPLEAFNVHIYTFCNAPGALMRLLITQSMVMSLRVPVSNNSCIKCLFMALWSSNDKSRQLGFVY